MKHFDRDTNQRTMPQGHAVIHTAVSLRRNLSDLFSLLGVANTVAIYLSSVYATEVMNGRSLPQQTRGHCRNDFVMNDFPALPQTAAL